MNRDNVLSLARSALKIIGSICLTAGIGTAGQVDAISTAVLDIIGAGMTLGGLFWSLWHHTPDEPPAMTLRAIAPDSIPADVAARMADTPPPAS